MFVISKTTWTLSSPQTPTDIWREHGVFCVGQIPFRASFHYYFISFFVSTLSSLTLSNPLSHNPIKELISIIPLFSSSSPSSVSYRSPRRRFRSQTPHELCSPLWDINRRGGGVVGLETPRRNESGKLEVGKEPGLLSRQE